MSSVNGSVNGNGNGNGDGAGSEEETHQKHRGILFGRTDRGNITEVIEALPCDGDIGTALTTLTPPKGLIPVGFFTTQPEDALRLPESDIAVASRYFPKPSHIFLVAQVGESGPGEATFFFWDEGKIHGEFAFLQFPLDPTFLAGRELQRRMQRSLPERAALPKPEGVAPVQVTVRKASRRWGPIAWILLSLIPLGLVGWRLWQIYALREAKPPAPATTQVTVSQPEVPVLGLRFQRQGSDLQVTWDANVVAQTGAETGLLSIRDGQKQRALGLSADQLRSANVLFAPTSDEVEIQLTLLLSNQKTISQSGIALFPLRGPATEQVRTIPTQARPVMPEQVQAAAPVLPSRQFVPPTSAAPARQTIDDLPVPLPQAGAVHSGVSNPVITQAPVPSIAAPPPPGLTPPSEKAAPATPSYVVGGDVKPAVVVVAPKPAYPAAAFNANVQGKVVVAVVVGVDGKVTQAKVESGHPLLNDAALSSVRSWLFRPALLNGKPIEAPARVEVNFHKQR